jgi:hypothetical protein
MKTYKVKIKKRTAPEEMEYGGQTNYGLDTTVSYNEDIKKSGLSKFLPSSTLQPVDRESANIEAELGETVVADFSGSGRLEHMKVGGKKHSKGGTPLMVPDDSFIFSNSKDLRLKASELSDFGKSKNSNKKYTPADIAKQYDINKYQAILDDPNADDMSKKTAAMMVQNYSKKLSQLALIQEAKKGFPNGIPDLAMPYLETMVEAIPNLEMVNTGNEFNYGGQYKYNNGGLHKFVTGGNPLDGIDPHTGDKRESKNPRTGVKSKDWNKSKYSKEEWERIKKDLGYTGPEDNKSFQKYLQNKFPDIVGKYHSADSGYGLPAAGTEIDGLLGIRWDAIVDEIGNSGAKLDPGMLKPKGITFPKPPEFTVTPPPNKQPTPNIPVPNDFNPIGNDPGVFDYMTPDKKAFMASLYNRANIKKYMPWEAPVTGTTVDPTFYDPTRELASNAEQMNTQMMYNSMFSGPQALGARNSAVAGNAAANAADILSKYNNMNVGVANQFAGVNADIMNHLLDATTQRATRLYDKTTVANQQYDNAVREADNQILGAGINAWNNRSNLSMLNDTNPYFYVDPVTGRQVFKSQNTKANFFGRTLPRGKQPTYQDYETEARGLGMTDPEQIKKYAYDKVTKDNAVYTDVNNDGYPDRSKIISQYTGVIGPYGQ